MENFKELNISDFMCNPFSKIGNEWMLITAGNKKIFNTMTASWGSLRCYVGKKCSLYFY